MIATYINKETGKDAYVQNFLAKKVNSKMEVQEERMVLIKLEDSIETLIMSKDDFKKSFKKK